MNILLKNSTTSSATTNKHLSEWKRTKILSKTLSSMEVIRSMKSKTASSATTQLTSTMTLNQQQTLKPKDSENQLKKSVSGNITTDSHHLNSPLNQIKRRSQEEVSTGLNTNTARLSSSLTSSCQTSIHNLNETVKTNTHTAATIQNVLNNLSSNTGTYNIPDNYNTNIINQLNKNYLKNIQKQKARSDWKSLKSKLVGLGRRESDEIDKVTDKTADTLEIQQILPIQ